MRHAIAKSFPITIPVLLGYIPLGIAFGLMMENAGWNIFWALLSSVAILTGTGQFIEVSFITLGTALYEVILITIILNSRMMFYGLSFLDRYKEIGPRKWYLIFSLTDETYALLTAVKPPEGVKEKDFLLAVSALDHSYWIIGTVIGVTAGSLLKIDTTGVDYVMTILFVVLAMDQWKAYASHEPVLIGLVSSVLSLVIFGPDNFMIPALILITVLLIVRRSKIEPKVATAESTSMDSGSEAGMTIGADPVIPCPDTESIMVTSDE
ncbi:MAG: AzlC family ABC transporter permease [Clostridiales Family XIII bacterium]|jgi:4-azaleucine resistance transporter AzlC|nr:AzlC family ABC transporter permease [Clostridiales Family XIII bacterium]